MNIKRQIRNIISENLNSENTSTENYTNYKFDIPEVGSENQVGLKFELIVILGVAAAILSILYCIFRLRKSLYCCLIQIRTFYEFTSIMYSYLTRIISFDENSKPDSSFLHLSIQDLKESPSRIQSIHPEFRSTITQTNDHTSSLSGSELELRKIQSTYSECRSTITQTSDHTSSSSGYEWKLRKFIINSEVVYGYILNPPDQTARSKPERKRLSDRHSI